MKLRTLRNATQGTTLASQVARARDPWTRGVGLLMRRTVTSTEGLWIDGCSAVHTMGMRAELDLIFLDSHGLVMRVVTGAKPNRLAFACRRATAVVELGAATDLGDRVALGDRLVLE